MRNTDDLLPYIRSSSERLTPEETEQLQIKLWQLVAWQSQSYAAGDSSSLRIETAKELFASVCFLLQMYQTETHIPWQDLLNQDTRELLKKSRELAESKVLQAKNIYIYVQQSFPYINNVFLRDTLKNIDIFFQKYNVYFFAHQIPCHIDYPLAWPVSETLHGIEYMLLYLHRLLIENHFLQCFPAKEINSLLSLYMPDYELAPITMYEPVAVNALGCQMLARKNCSLHISWKEKRVLQQSLRYSSHAELRSALLSAADALAGRLSLSAPAETEYLQHTVHALIPRFKIALDVQNLNGIFIS